jgi:hypothetical protein
MPILCAGEIAAGINQVVGDRQGIYTVIHSSAQRLPVRAIKAGNIIGIGPAGIGEIAAGVKIGAVGGQRAHGALNAVLASVSPQGAPLGSVPGSNVTHPQTAGNGEGATDIQLAAAGHRASAGRIQVARGRPCGAVPRCEIGGAEAARVGEVARDAEQAIQTSEAIGSRRSAIQPAAQGRPVRTIPFGNAARRRASRLGKNAADIQIVVIEGQRIHQGIDAPADARPGGASQAARLVTNWEPQLLNRPPT